MIDREKYRDVLVRTRTYVWYSLFYTGTHWPGYVPVVCTVMVTIIRKITMSSDRTTATVTVRYLNILSGAYILVHTGTCTAINQVYRIPDAMRVSILVLCLFPAVCQ